MKQYILICVNEEKQVVSCNSYKTIDQAVTKMRSEYYTELRDKFTTYHGNERFIHFDYNPDNNSAYVCYNEFECFWEIKESEIPE